MKFWQAVLERDISMDGKFVYAVKTTGVFCRPSCPSRRPHKNNVQFFDDCAPARAAGFRPCMRCNPERGAASSAQELCLAVCQFIDAADHTPSLNEIAAYVERSPYHLQRLFKQTMGLSPKKYADGVRGQRLKDKLSSGRSCTDALYEAGFEGSSSAYQRAGKDLGMTPGSYKRNASRENIRYTTVDCCLGVLMVACTQKGVCRVAIADTADGAIEGLKTEFANAVSAADDDLQEAVRQIVSYLDGQGRKMNFPLDLRATVFQQRVWQELQRIPYGQTRSYEQIAQALGEPSASRAVAGACAANPVALVVPCHRVLRKNGEISGYAWGVERKRKLLNLERED